MTSKQVREGKEERMGQNREDNTTDKDVRAIFGVGEAKILRRKRTDQKSKQTDELSRDSKRGRV